MATTPRKAQQPTQSSISKKAVHTLLPTLTDEQLQVAYMTPSGKQAINYRKAVVVERLSLSGADKTKVEQYVSPVKPKSKPTPSKALAVRTASTTQVSKLSSDELLNAISSLNNELHVYNAELKLRTNKRKA